MDRRSGGTAAEAVDFKEWDERCPARDSSPTGHLAVDEGERWASAHRMRDDRTRDSSPAEHHSSSRTRETQDAREGVGREMFCQGLLPDRTSHRGQGREVGQCIQLVDDECGVWEDRWCLVAGSSLLRSHTPHLSLMSCARCPTSLPRLCLSCTDAVYTFIMEEWKFCVSVVICGG